MVELEGGSKLIRVESRTLLCTSWKKEKEKTEVQTEVKTKVETKEYNVAALKDENEELKSKIVSLKRDFEKIIGEVRTLQKCVSEQSQKTKDKFIKIKMIVNTLKKERENSFIQNKYFSDQVDSLVKENVFLRLLLEQNKVAKKARTEHVEKKKETSKETEQSLENVTVEETKKKILLKVAENPLPVNTKKSSKKNILKWKNDNTTYMDGGNGSSQLFTQLQQMGTIEIEPQHEKKRVSNRNQINSSVPHHIKCKKTLMKKRVKSLEKNLCIIISKNKDFLKTFSYLCSFSLFPLTSETLQTCKSFHIKKSLHWNNKSDKDISSQYIKKKIAHSPKSLHSLHSLHLSHSPNFAHKKYSISNKKNNSIHLKHHQYCNVSVFSNMPETHFVYNTKKEETVEEVFNTNTVYMCFKKERIGNIIEEKEIEEKEIEEKEIEEKEKEEKDKEKNTYEYELIHEPENVAKETEMDIEKEEKDKNLVISNLNNEVVEWKMKNKEKEKEYLLYTILRICKNLKTEALEKLQKEINQHFPVIAINYKKEKEFHFLKTENFINETAFYRFLSLFIDSICKHITHQHKKINQFEMSINNINIFSHNLIDILNETSYMKSLKKHNNHQFIHLVIQNIIKECQ